MSAVLQFDESAHRYTLDGMELPSVTHILDDVFDEYRSIDAETLRRAQERGTAVHRACELYDKDQLDFSSLDPTIAPYLEAYINFLSETGFSPQVIEQSVNSQKYGYAGTLDRIGTPKRSKHRWQVDIKTSVVLGKTVGPQTAAYDQAARECGLISTKEKVSRFALQLRDDGKYRLTPFDSASDFSIFLSALTIYKFKRGQ